MDRLSIPGPNATQKELNDATVTNSKIIQQGVDKLGINILLNFTSTVVQNVTSTNFTKLNEFQKSVTTSGGSIFVICKIAINNPSSNKVRTAAQLLIDDVVKDYTQVPTNDVIDAAYLTLFWLGDMNAGVHTFKISVKVSSDNMNFGTANTLSSMYIAEILKG